MRIGIITTQAMKVLLMTMKTSGAVMTIIILMVITGMNVITRVSVLTTTKKNLQRGIFLQAISG